MSTHLLFLFSCCIGISCTRTSPFYGLFLLIFIHWDSTQSPCQSINMRQRFKLFIVGYTSVKVYHQTRCPKMGYTSSISIPTAVAYHYHMNYQIREYHMPRLVWINQWMKWTFIYYQDILSGYNFCPIGLRGRVGSLLDIWECPSWLHSHCESPFSSPSHIWPVLDSICHMSSLP
jgi:hypothetical protein